LAAEGVDAVQYRASVARKVCGGKKIPPKKERGGNVQKKNKKEGGLKRR